MTSTKKTLGFTTTELLITLVVVSVLALLTAQVIADAMRSSQYRQLTLTRDQVAIGVRTSAGNIQGLLNSLKQPENAFFYNCVCGSAAGCTSALSLPFTLYDIPTNPLKPIATYYNGAGFPCQDNTAANCLISVKLRFVAQCAPTMPNSFPYPPYTCTAPAEFFGISFQVSQNSLVPNQPTLFKSVSGIVFKKVADLNPPGSGVCP